MRSLATLVSAVVLHALACAPKEKVIRGTVDVAPELAAAVAASDTIFVIARRGQGGPPLAVKKLPVSAFPLAFELSDKDLMMGGPFEGDVELLVRIDKDGDAMTRAPGDLMGRAKGQVHVGDTKVAVTIDQRLP